MSKPQRVSETPAVAFLKAHGVDYTEHVYEYVEHGNRSQISALSAAV
jgi:hypothetical protein